MSNPGFTIVRPSATLLSSTPDPERLIERAGRVCYRSEVKITASSHKEFIKRLIRNGHTSVLEHASATILFVTDRGISHELVRHRIASYSQESTRYCSYNLDPVQVIEPPGLGETSFCIWQASVLQSLRAYSDLLACGLKPQIARAVLPNCLATRIVSTFNFRMWRHILSLRLQPSAHPQIQEIMKLAKTELISIAPTVFGDLA